MSFLADVLTHSAFFIVFLTTFYFTFVLYIQNESIVSDMYNMMKPSLMLQASFSSVAELQQLITKIDRSLSDAESTLVFADNNPTILRNVGIVVGVSSFVALTLGILIQHASGGSIFELLISNLIVIGFIAASEFAIVGLFMQNFIEIDQAFVASVAPYRNDSSSSCKFVIQYLRTILPDAIASIFIPADEQTGNGSSPN